MMSIPHSDVKHIFMQMILFYILSLIVLMQFKMLFLIFTNQML